MDDRTAVAIRQSSMVLGSRGNLFCRQWLAGMGRLAGWCGLLGLTSCQRRVSRCRESYGQGRSGRRHEFSRSQCAPPNLRRASTLCGLHLYV